METDGNMKPGDPNEGRSDHLHLRRGSRGVIWRRFRALISYLSRNKAISILTGIFVLWSGYIIVIEGIARMVMRDERQLSGRFSVFLDEADGMDAAGQSRSDIPALARYDSFWFHDIAKYGYSESPREHDTSPERIVQCQRRRTFFPLYPLAMRLGARCFSAGVFTVGLWVSRLALLLSLVLLAFYHRPSRGDDDDIWTPLVALLCFPSAFVLVSVYSESLFLMMALSSFFFTNRGRYLCGAAAACLAGLTRINGLALIPALLIAACVKWRQGERSIWPFAPAMGVIAAYGLLGSWHAWQFGDPFAFLTAKKEIWGISLSTPWATVDGAMGRFRYARALHDLGSLHAYLEFPCVCLIAGSVVLLLVHRLWPEALFVAAGGTLTLVSGTLWGLPRYTLLLFPVFISMGRLHRRRRVLWHLYVLLSGLAQACLLVNYVNGWHPASP